MNWMGKRDKPLNLKRNFNQLNLKDRLSYNLKREPNEIKMKVGNDEKENCKRVYYTVQSNFYKI